MIKLAVIQWINERRTPQSHLIGRGSPDIVKVGNSITGV